MNNKMEEARRVLLQNGYGMIKEGYEDATPPQIAGMQSRLQNYIETGSEFKIKSKTNKLGLVVYVEVKEYDEEDGTKTPYYVLRNANTNAELCSAGNVDDLIKSIYNVQAHLEEFQKEESLVLNLNGFVAEGLKKYEYVILPDTEPFTQYFDMNKQVVKCSKTNIYLHGEAESDAGFDISFILPANGNTKAPTGKFKVGIVTSDGIKEGWMFAWPMPDFPVYTTGLIAYTTDTAMVQDAERKFKIRPRHI